MAPESAAQSSPNPEPRDPDGLAAEREASARLHRLEASAGTARDLDPLIHDRVRLAILAALASTGDLDFVALREACRATDGNLITHARRLEEGGYIRSSKKKLNKRPQRIFRLTPKGRTALSRYLDHMGRLLDALG